MKPPARSSTRGLVAVLALGATVASAQSGPVTPVADPRIAARLESAQLHYVVDEDGDFRILYVRPGGRTQVAWIASATSSAGGLELRDLWSVALRGRGDPSHALTTLLLQHNAARSFGAWQLQRSGEEYLVVLSAAVPADADGTVLARLVESVMADTDDMEKALTDGDQF
jgi:hypothetical protein